MVLPELRLLQAAIILAEELNFSRAAARLRIDQSTLSRQIVDLEHFVVKQLFERTHQRVTLTEAGVRLVEESRQGMAHIERGVVAARADCDSEVLHVGRSASTDPWLVSAIKAVHLPFNPALRIQWSSNSPHELAREIASGTLDLALTTGVPENPMLSCLRLAEHPFYIAMAQTDRLAAHKEIRLADLSKRIWILFSRHISPHLFDTIQSEASNAGVGSSEVHYVTGAEEAVPLILEHGGLAFLTRTEAWRVATDGITMRPLAEERLRLVTCLTASAECKSRLIGEFVKATARKLDSLRKPVQAQLPLSA